MTAPTEETNVTFENLISTCQEAHERFRHAAAVAEDKAVRRLLSIYAQQRNRFAQELLQEIGGTGEDRPQTASTGREIGPVASLAGRVQHPKDETDGESDLDLIRQCLQTETRALESYRDALGNRIPTRAHFLVSAQHALMQKAHERMQGMLAATAAPRRAPVLAVLSGPAL